VSLRPGLCKQSIAGYESELTGSILRDGFRLVCEATCLHSTWVRRWRDLRLRPYCKRDPRCTGGGGGRWLLGSVQLGIGYTLVTLPHTVTPQRYK
jgi:hypothetical protein